MLAKESDMHYYPNAKIEWAYIGSEDQGGVKVTKEDGAVILLTRTEQDFEDAWAHGFNAGTEEALEAIQRNREALANRAEQIRAGK